MSKKKFKMPSAFTILMVLIVLVSILTWFIPAGEWVEGVYRSKASNPQGVWQILAAPLEGFFAARGIILFIIVIGGFLNIIMKTGSLDAGIGRLLKKFNGKEQVLIPILMILFGIGGTTYGMSEETIAFYPLIIPVFLAAGYDVVTGVMVILVGSCVGVLASTVNPFAIGAASEAAGISMGLGLVHRIVLFVILETIAIVWTMKYAKKVRKDKSKSLVSDLHEEHVNKFLKNKDNDGEVEFTGRHKFILFVFALTFVIMILGVIPWESKFNITIFANIYNWFAEKLPFLGLIPNTLDSYWDGYDAVKTYPASLGDWWFGQMTVLFLVSAVIIGMIGKLKESEIVDAFIEGAKDLLSVAIIIGVARGIKVVMSSGGMDATVLYWGAESLKKLGKVLFINLGYLFYIPMSFLIPSTSGLAGASMPIMGPIADAVYNSTSTGTGASLMITAFSAASGVVNLITPTSGVVMGGLALANVPYERWLKHLLKFIILASIVIMVLLSLITMFNITV